MLVHLIDVFKKSVASPAFYGELIKKPLKYSLKYYYQVAIFLSVAMTIIASFYGVPGGFFAVRTIAPAIVRSIPDDFSLTLKNGIALSAREDPIVIEWPDHEAIRTAAEYERYKNFLVIDTRSNATPQIFKDSDAMFLITRNSFVSSIRDTVQAMSFAGLPDIVVTKDSFASLVRESQNSFHWIIFAFIFFTFARFLFMFTVELILFIPLAVVFWALLSRERVGIQVPFQKAYQFALHTASLALIYYAFILVYPSFYVPFLPSVITVVVFWANILRDKGAHLRSIHAHAAHSDHHGAGHHGPHHKKI